VFTLSQNCTANIISIRIGSHFLKHIKKKYKKIQINFKSRSPKLLKYKLENSKTIAISLTSSIRLKMNIYSVP